MRTNKGSVCGTLVVPGFRPPFISHPTLRRWFQRWLLGSDAVVTEMSLALMIRVKGHGGSGLVLTAGVGGQILKTSVVFPNTLGLWWTCRVGVRRKGTIIAVLSLMLKFICKRVLALSNISAWLGKEFR